MESADKGEIATWKSGRADERHKRGSSPDKFEKSSRTEQEIGAALPMFTGSCGSRERERERERQAIKAFDCRPQSITCTVCRGKKRRVESGTVRLSAAWEFGRQGERGRGVDLKIDLVRERERERERRSKVDNGDKLVADRENKLLAEKCDGSRSISGNHDD
jgi:hypothetical protein